jgi:hypothetical protein
MGEAHSALRLPIPLGFKAGSLKLTVPEDEFRVAIIGRVGSA